MKIVQAATKAFIVKDGKFLVIKQKIDDKTYVDLPGGRMEYGLTPEENLKKEVKEEVDLEIEVGKLVGSSYFFRDLDKGHVLCLLFECMPKTLDIDLTKNEDPEEEIVSFEWMTPKDFMNIEAPNGIFLRTTKKVVNDHFIKKNMPI